VGRRKVSLIAEGREKKESINRSIDALKKKKKKVSESQIHRNHTLRRTEAFPCAFCLPSPEKGTKRKDAK